MAVKASNRIVILIVLFGLLSTLVIFSVYSWRQKSSSPSLSSLPSEPSSSFNTVEDKEGQDDKDAQETVSETQPASVPKILEGAEQLTSSLQDLTTIKFSRDEEKAIKSLVDSFETAFFNQDWSALFPLFLTEVRSGDLENQIIAAPRALPQSYKVEKIDLRSDSTAIVTLSEIRSDNSSVQRLLEVVPFNTSYAIAQYFSNEKQSTYGGF